MEVQLQVPFGSPVHPHPFHSQHMPQVQALVLGKIGLDLKFLS